MTVYEELERIRRANAGILRPEQVVEFARDPATALHHCFLWDDTAAAHQWRLEQARQIIRSVRIRYQDDAPPIHCYVSLVPDRRRGDSYRHIRDVQAVPELLRQLIDQALREAQAWADRWRRFAALQPIRDAIAEVSEKQNALVEHPADAVKPG